MLLAIDTSAGTSVAVVDRDAGVLAERSSEDPRAHAEVVGELIRESLAAAGIPVTALSGVAAGMGPGPFTGLRVGIAAARAFAFGIGRPVVPVISHDAVAVDALRGTPGPLVVVSDARRRELFVSVYSGADEHGLPVRSSAPAVAKAAEFEAPAGHRLVTATAVSAASLGLIAEARYALGVPFDADEPVYLRSPDVTVSPGPKRVSS